MSIKKKKKHAKWKKPDIKGHILYASIYMKCSDSKSVEFTETESGLVVVGSWPGAGEVVVNGEKQLMGMGFFLRWWKYSNIYCDDGCTIYEITKNSNELNILKTTELYTLKEWISWYVNYRSIKMF